MLFFLHKLLFFRKIRVGDPPLLTRRHPDPRSFKFLFSKGASPLFVRGSPPGSVVSALFSLRGIFLLLRTRRNRGRPSWIQGPSMHSGSSFFPKPMSVRQRHSCSLSFSDAGGPPAQFRQAPPVRAGFFQASKVDALKPDAVGLALLLSSWRRHGRASLPPFHDLLFPRSRNPR